jgi:hypothetical protein
MTEASESAYPKPQLPQPPQSIIDAAKQTTPDTLTRMPNETGWGAQNPGAGHRVVLAAQLVEQLIARGHNPAAAEWTVYQLVEASLLIARPGVKETRAVIGHRPDENDIRWKARRFYGESRWKTIPVYGEPVREVVNDRWLVNSTDALWKWWRDSWPGGDSTGATASSAADLPVSPGIKAMSDDAILRACFDELLEHLADRGDALDVFHSPCVEQLNGVAKSLGFEALIIPRYLKKGPNVGRHWAVMDPGTSEIADQNDYDAIAVDVIDPFSRGAVRRIVIAAGKNKLCEANPDATADLKAMLRRWIKSLEVAHNMVQSAPAPLSVAAAAPPSADDLMTARGQASLLLSAAGTARMSARTLTRDSRRPSPDERDRFVESARLLRECYFAVAPEGVPVRARQWEKLRPFWELDGEQITDAERTDRTAHDLVLYLAAETLGAVGTLISSGEHRDPWIWEAAMAKAAALPEIDQHKLGALLHREHDRGVRRITPTPAGSVGEDGSVELSGSPAPLPTPPPSTSDTTRTCATFPAEWKDPRRCPSALTYAIELDDGRADALRMAIPDARVLAPASFFGCRASLNSFSFIWLNPPFDDGYDGHRVEDEFLQTATDWLKPGGVMALVCPEDVADEYSDVRRHFTTCYENCMIVPFPDGHRPFGEVIVFGHRRSRSIANPEASAGLVPWESVEAPPGFCYDIPAGSGPRVFQKVEPTESELRVMLADSPLRRHLV